MNFQKEQDYLLCIDSDGCAVNTMTVKHERFFGPHLVEVWQLEAYASEILKQWQTINLYSMNRGINRFKGLLMMLEMIDQEGLSHHPIPDISQYCTWVQTTEALSNQSLEAAMTETEDLCMQLAYKWSMQVNASVATFENEDLIFDHVYETLERASQVADIIVVSSANTEAVLNEWEKAGIAKYAKYFAGQELGTKSECIQLAMKVGYDSEQVMMIGDSPGDHLAAKESGVRFYPILPGQESDSWQQLGENFLQKFVANDYSQEDQKTLERAFFERMT